MLKFLTDYQDLTFLLASLAVVAILCIVCGIYAIIRDQWLHPEEARYYGHETDEVVPEYTLSECREWEDLPDAFGFRGQDDDERG